ncbi:hypothetical protein CEXT_495431 [Caerostris extrusa]|uniref:Uncharacterized protein n=1 Tax=Caerostris extrusa TaxID=172846 RepID=A0AAV4PZK7_CAEEX|nr:hypothetical protein CEXT_495431 [Caerostris extrusa]
MKVLRNVPDSSGYGVRSPHHRHSRGDPHLYNWPLLPFQPGSRLRQRRVTASHIAERRGAAGQTHLRGEGRRRRMWGSRGRSPSPPSDKTPLLDDMESSLILYSH